MEKHRSRLLPVVLGLAVVGMVVASCSTDHADNASTGSSSTAVVTTEHMSTTTSSDPASTSTSAQMSTTPPIPTTTLPDPEMPELTGGDVIAFSLPPRFGARDVDMPLVVYTLHGAASVHVVDAAGNELTRMTAQTPHFWFGTIPGVAVDGDSLIIRAVARLDDGSEMTSRSVTVPLMVANGTTLSLRPVSADTTVLYDRPWSNSVGELAWLPAEAEGIATTPPAIAALSDREVAVLDTAASRVTCFDLTGRATCTVPLPIAASGDLFAIGDRTLIATDFSNRDRHQEASILRIDPRTQHVETVYHEYPLVVDGYPMISTNLRFDWDPSSMTAWVGLPGPGMPTALPPDPSRSQLVDAFHIANHSTRGPTLSRQAFSPYVTASSLSLVDGPAWVNIYDHQPNPSVEDIAVTPSGTVWMVIDTATPNDTVQASIVRWHPGDTFADVTDFEHSFMDLSTRQLAALDDNSVAYLDSNVGGRIRVITFPESAPDRPR